MTINVSELVRGEITTGKGSGCATCIWLRSREQAERLSWQAEMDAPAEQVPATAIQRAMRKASDQTKGLKPPGSGSIRTHRMDKHKP